MAQVLTVRCPASSNVTAPRCEEVFAVTYSEKTHAFEGECPKHTAVRIAAGCAASCARDAEALKAAKEAARKAAAKGKAK